jgi:hypothetical protein
MHVEGAEGTRQQVRQSPLDTVISLVSLQDLELGFERAASLALRPAKEFDQFRGQRQGISRELKPLRHDLLSVITMDQQLGW